jgi:hypothetical protein
MVKVPKTVGNNFDTRLLAVWAIKLVYSIEEVYGFILERIVWIHMAAFIKTRKYCDA